VALSLGHIVESLGGELHGDVNLQIEALAPLATAGTGALAFLSHPKYQQQLASTGATCVIVTPVFAEAAHARGACIVTPDPYHYFARLTQLWKKSHSPARLAGVHPSAVVDPDAHIHPSATIGPLCVVERGACIGADTVLKSRVVVNEDCVIGDRCLLHPGVVIGADGFGFAPHQGLWEKIEQLGAVRIGNDVEIGANSCVDRGAVGDTVLEDGVKLDNLVQIGHNVFVGRHTAMAGCAGVAGSAHIGANCTVGGGAVVLGHLTLADGVNVSASTTVTRSINKPGLYTGIFPTDDNASWEKNAVTLKHLYQLRERIKALEANVTALQSNENTPT
jgi:UDP-3-O-[3-hydroxymyristoyl] glucosamine N-acyltransferase